MGEKKGLILTIFIVLCFFLPAGLDYLAQNIKSDQVMQAATQLQQLVKEEGGNTPTVNTVVKTMEANGLRITISTDVAGRNKIPVSNTRLKAGTEVYLDYYYEREPIFGIRQDKRVLRTNNKVIINRR